MKRGEFVRIEKILMFSRETQQDDGSHCSSLIFLEFTQWFLQIELALYDIDTRNRFDASDLERFNRIVLDVSKNTSVCLFTRSRRRIAPTPPFTNFRPQCFTFVQFFWGVAILVQSLMSSI